MASFGDTPLIPVVSTNYLPDSDEFEIVFTSENGVTYSAYGGSDLEGRDTWPELSTGDLVGDGSDLTFTYPPASSPPVFFLEIRED